MVNTHTYTQRTYTHKTHRQNAYTDVSMLCISQIYTDAHVHSNKRMSECTFSNREEKTQPLRTSETGVVFAIIYIYIYIYIYIHTCTHAHTCTHTHTHTHTHNTYLYMYTNIHIQRHTYALTYTGKNTRFRPLPCLRLVGCQPCSS